MKGGLFAKWAWNQPTIPEKKIKDTDLTEAEKDLILRQQRQENENPRLRMKDATEMNRRREKNIETSIQSLREELLNPTYKGDIELNEFETEQLRKISRLEGSALKALISAISVYNAGERAGNNLKFARNKYESNAYKCGSVTCKERGQKIINAMRILSTKYSAETLGALNLGTYLGTTWNDREPEYKGQELGECSFNNAKDLPTLFEIVEKMTTDPKRSKEINEKKYADYVGAKRLSELLKDIQDRKRDISNTNDPVKISELNPYGLDTKTFECWEGKVAGANLKYDDIYNDIFLKTLENMKNIEETNRNCFFKGPLDADKIVNMVKKLEEMRPGRNFMDMPLQKILDWLKESGRNEPKDMCVRKLLDESIEWCKSNIPEPHTASALENLGPTATQATNLRYVKPLTPYRIWKGGKTLKKQKKRTRKR